MRANKMIEGQWTGQYVGDHNGICILNIEKKEDELKCISYFLNALENYPSFYASFKMPKNLSEYYVRVEDIMIVGRDKFVVDPIRKSQVLSEQYGGVNITDAANVHLNFKDGKLNLTVHPDIGEVLTVQLSKEYVDGYKIPAEVVSWKQFQALVSEVNYRKVAFRGQADTWPLRTSFNRNNRYDVRDYVFKDIPMLHRHLSGLTKHYFNMSDSQHYGAFHNLLQHHGYPTPLLDWSYSPYVAAYFAFSKIERKEIEALAEDRFIRIFLFEVEAWRYDWEQITHLLDSRLHISVGEFIALDNQRALPQQALTIVTNVYDIEGYIYSYGGMTGKYLRAFDIPIIETYNAMRDLTLMGITYGALFPGLDGACADLKKINFPD